MNPFLKERENPVYFVSVDRSFSYFWNWNEHLGLSDQMTKMISTGMRMLFFFFSFFSFPTSSLTGQEAIGTAMTLCSKGCNLAGSSHPVCYYFVKDSGVLMNQSWRWSLGTTSGKLRSSVAFLMSGTIRWKPCFSINWLSNKVKRAKSCCRWDLSWSELGTSAVPKQGEVTGEAFMTCNV